MESRFPAIKKPQFALYPARGRSSIITSRYPHNLGPTAELHQPIATNIPWLPTVLREHGYDTSIIGKNHRNRENSKVGSETWDRVDIGKSPDNDGAESQWAQAIRESPNEKLLLFWFAAFDAHDLAKGSPEDFFQSRMSRTANRLVSFSDRKSTIQNSTHF